jgi:hypothetical protein
MLRPWELIYMANRQDGGAPDAPWTAWARDSGMVCALPAESVTREDTYLLQPGVQGLSVKPRHGRSLDVKSFPGYR